MHFYDPKLHTWGAKVHKYFKCLINDSHADFFCLFVCNRGDTIQYHGGLRSSELGQAPMLQVFLTPRQALSSHPLKQMVWLYWLQDRDSVPNWYNINHPTTFHTQWNPVTHCTAVRWHFALQDVSHRQSCHLSTPSHPRVPPEWPYCLQAQCGR